MTNSYKPEGYIIDTPENKEHLSCISGLEYAMGAGLILEARAVLCDSRHRLVVELGEYKGIIPKEEAAYSTDGSEIRDIAVITRVGKPVCFKIKSIIMTESGPEIILSRRLAQYECFEKYVSRLECGTVIDAKITHIEPFGAFCDIGCGIVSLLPVDCISVSRITGPSERFVPGDSIKAAVKTKDEGTGRISLTHKELLGTWEENASAFSPGETAAGIVRSVEPYGIFVELAPNLAGLAEWCENVYPGQNAAVYIKSIIPEKMKIKLVIVDSHFSDSPRKKLQYFISDGKIEYWRYSPENCDREIVTDFTAEQG